MKAKKTQSKVLKGMRIIDGKGGEVFGKAVVVCVEGSRIKEVGSEDKVCVPHDAEVIEMTDCTLMPGLIDLHVHLASYNTLNFENYRVAQMEVPPQLQILYALLHAQMCFEMGYTTLRDMTWVTSRGGHTTAELVAIRDAIATGIMAGPRLLVGGLVTTTNSHLELVHPSTALRQPALTADGPWELRKLVRTQMRTGCDFIKTANTGGVSVAKEGPDVRIMTEEELNAIVNEAHFFHKQVASHCLTATGQRIAVKAGVDTIEHCVYTDDEAIAMIKDANIPVVPTLLHRSDKAIEVMRCGGAPEYILDKMRMVQPYTKETFQKMHQAGIKIAMGTDVETDPEMGTNSEELEIYEDYGMTAMEAIQTATNNAAEAVRLDQEIGTLEAGKLADIIAVEGNPLEDITILQDREKIRMVMKEGNIFVDKRPGHNKYVVQNQEWNWDRI